MASITTAAHKRSRRRFLELATICLGVAIIGWLVLPRIQHVIVNEWTARDRFVTFVHRQDLSREFVFLAIDESSIRMDHLWPEDLAASPTLAAMSGGFPWPRTVYADAIDRITGAGAKLVLLDLIFDRPREGDAALKAALDRHRDKVVIVSNYSVSKGDPSKSDDDIPTITLPTPGLIPTPEDDPRVGYANFWAGAGEVVRESVYSSTLNERLGKPSLPGERVYQSLSGAALRQLGLPDPSPQRRPLYFEFGKSDTVPTYPFHALFVPYEWKQDLRDGATLAGKIVMIGPSATRLQDFHLTPLGRMPGPMLHINALAAALNGAFYRPASETSGALVVGMAALVALGFSWRLQRHPLLAFGALVSSGALYLLLVFAVLEWGEYLLHIVRPLAVLAIAGTSCVAWNFARERRDSGRMRSTLERYVSRNVVREILDNRDDFLNALGGTRRPMTVFFSDVRGFTSFSERSDAATVVEQLNEYLGEMVGIIFRHHGTVDKFMGDGIMAVWGNVVSQGVANDAAQALTAALEMLDRLGDLNERWRARGFPPFAIGIGLHHGEAVFGNIGSAEKMEPTVIGDTVNLTSRVEGLTKKYGVTLCVTQALAALVYDQFHFRSVDLVQVVGKSRPVEILTVLGPSGTAVPSWLAIYEGGVADFRAHRFAEAAAHFRLTLQAVPDDKLSKIYLARCEAFLIEPPPADWVGAEIATSK